MKRYFFTVFSILLSLSLVACSSLSQEEVVQENEVEEVIEESDSLSESSKILIGLLKDTSLAASITIYDMFLASQRIAARTYETFALYLEVAVIYLIFCTVLTKLQMLYEKKLQIE